MPDNKGLPVHGYQAQTDQKVATVNVNKMLEEEVLRRLDLLAADPDVDKRWLATGRTDIEKGFMAVNRAIFRRGRIKLDSDPRD